MKNFNQEFLDVDWRKNKPERIGFIINDQKTLHKHQRLLPPELIAGKSVLDIGSYISQTGDWCLNHGATKYTGVEMIKDFSDKGTELMQKYHAGEPWEIINSSVEDYFANHKEKYDSIFCWGVTLSQIDNAWFLENLCKRCDHMATNWRQPRVMWIDNHHEISDELWKKLEYDIPYQEWQEDVLTQTAGKNGSVYCSSAHPSMKAVQLLMKMNGFSSNTDSYEYFKEVMPADIGMFRESPGFFVVEGTRDAKVSGPTLFNEIHKKPEVWNEKWVDWS